MISNEKLKPGTENPSKTIFHLKIFLLLLLAFWESESPSLEESLRKDKSYYKSQQTVKSSNWWEGEEEDDISETEDEQEILSNKVLLK